MARMIVDTDMQEEPPVMNGTLMIHKEPPAMIVMATGIVIGDEFPGVDLDTGAYGEQWIITEFNVFRGAIKLEQ